MNTAAVLTNLFIVLLVMTAASAVEVFIPFREQSRRDTSRVRTNLSLMAINLLLGLLFNGVLLAGAGYLSAKGFGLFRYVMLPGPIATGIAIVALDLSSYAAHVCLHKSTFLWRCHLVHHTDVAVDATTTYRTHPIEALTRLAFTAAMAWGLGVSPAALALYRLLSALNAIFEHANVRLPLFLDRTLVLMWVTPDMHKIHHSRLQVETDSNYANLFSVFDRVFGTFTSTSRVSNVQYGISGLDSSQHRSLLAVLKTPFLRRSLDLHHGGEHRVTP